MHILVILIVQSLQLLPLTSITQQYWSSACDVTELMVYCAHSCTRQCTVTCQIIRSWATMLVMSASRCPTCIYDLLAARVLLSCAHEVKAIKVTSLWETTQHLSSSFTPSAAGVSLDLPACSCTHFPLIRNSLILLPLNTVDKITEVSPISAAGACKVGQCNSTFSRVKDRFMHWFRATAVMMLISEGRDPPSICWRLQRKPGNIEQDSMLATAPV